MDFLGLRLESTGKFMAFTAQGFKLVDLSGWQARGPAGRPQNQEQ
jgi:hypothetical protein